MSPLHPGQLPPFRFETETKPKSKPIRPNRIRSKQVRLNVAERRAATRVSMSELRRRKLKEFDYEAYRADFAKRYISTNLIHWYLDLQHTHDDLEENERDWPPQLRARRPCMPTFITKFMIYYTISSAHPADASDIIDRIILSYTVSVLDQRLSCLKFEPRTLVPYNFSCGISGLDEQNIMIDPLGIQQEDSSSNV